MSHIPQDAARRLVDKLGTAAAPHPPIAQPQWMALLVRDVAAEFGVQPLHVCNVLREEGQGDFSVNTAITPDQYAVVCERLKSYASPVARPQAADPAQQLPHAYLLEKLRRVMPMLQEARDALTAITEAQRKLHERYGNSRGLYHTGFTDLHYQSRTTANAHEARRYTEAEARKVANALNDHMMQDEWRAVEHGFETAPAAAPSAPAPAEVPEPESVGRVRDALDGFPWKSIGVGQFDGRLVNVEEGAKVCLLDDCLAYAAAREAAAVRDDPLRIRALEELAQLGYTVRDDLLYPPATAAAEPAPAEVQMPEPYATLHHDDGYFTTKARDDGKHPRPFRTDVVTLEQCAAYAAAREAAERERVRGVLEAAQNDAMRFRWLTEDHADPETRAKCRELLSRMGVMTYSAACTDIDSAMAQATKREMLRTAVEWQRRYEPTCAHGRYSDEDCTDCPRTAAAARAELGDGNV